MPLAAVTAAAWNRVVFGYEIAASDLHDSAVVTRISAGYVASLERLGGHRSGGGDTPVWFVATGGTERRLLDGWSAARPGVPCLLVAHPGHNSLPAALEALARIHQLGGRGVIEYLAGEDDAAGLASLEERVSDLAAWRRLHGIRIGLVGDPSDWLVASSPDPATLQAVWGPEVVGVSIGDLIGAHRPDPEAPVPGEGRSPDEVASAGGVTAALQALVGERCLDAVTVRCFDLIGALGTTGCVALSTLNDGGFVAGCEGDLVSVLGLVWVHEITGEIPWMANPARLSRAEGTLVLAHCTVPTGLVGSVRLDTHFESGIGVGISGAFQPGPVTLLRIGGPRLDALWVAEGDLVAGGDDPDLCRTQAKVRTGREAIEALLRNPLGNHLVMARGHHEAALRRYHDWLIAAPSAGVPATG